MSSLGLVCGVSGAGKTYAMKSVENSSISTVDLDIVLWYLYEDLDVGDIKSNHLSYTSWKNFLNCRLEDSQVLDAFRTSIFKERNQSASLLIVGNHFLVEIIEQVVINAIEDNFNRVERFLLDVDPDLVFKQRQKRNKPWDRDITKKQVESEVKKIRNTLVPRGYIVISQEKIRDCLREYFLG